MQVYIYALIDPDTDEIRYIGKANDLIARYRDHIWSWSKRRDRSHKTNWIRSLKARGKRPQLLILEKVSARDWREREKWWIALYKTFGSRLTNHSVGGEGPDELLELHKQKIAQARKKQKLTEHQRQTLIYCNRTRIWTSAMRKKVSKAKKGTKHTEEAKQKMRVAHQNCPPMSREARMKISKALKGQPKSKAHRDALSKALTGRKSGPRSALHKMKIGQGNSILTADQVVAIRKIREEQGLTYKAIAEMYGVHLSTIALVCQRKHYGWVP